MSESAAAPRLLNAITNEQDRAAARALVLRTPPSIVPEPTVPTVASTFVPFAARNFRHTKSNDPILGVNKITYSHFLKTVWVLSNTNLHIKDFEAEYGEQLKRIFHPVPLRNGGAA